MIIAQELNRMAAKKKTPRQSSAAKVRRPRAKLAGRGFGEDSELSPNQVRELERRIADLNCRTRYLIASVLDTDFVLYYNVSEDTYGWNDPSHATLFKRRRAAQTVLQLVGDKDIVAECCVNKRGQLIKKSVLLPHGVGHTPAAGRQRTKGARIKKKPSRARKQ